MQERDITVRGLVRRYLSVDLEIGILLFELVVDIAEGVVDYEGAKRGLKIGEEENFGGLEVAEGRAELDCEVGQLLSPGFEDYYDALGA